MKDYSAIINQLEEKYDKLGLDTQTMLEGLLYSQPITYWDYIQPDALLSLQKQRTPYPDEMIFIVYHQVTELFLKMLNHEAKQIAEKENITADYFIEKLQRINRYIQLLANSFDVMRSGMGHEQYNYFRLTLTPASGFQCASFRFSEIYCSDLINLVDPRFKEQLKDENDVAVLIENMYWQAAGKNHKTGDKSYLLSQFEEKYLEDFVEAAEEYKTKNLWQKYVAMPESERSNPELIQAMKDLDVEFNIKWPLVHLRTAEHYMENGKEVTPATGGSEWKKYLHPKYQKRVFFPGLWTNEEMSNWAQEYA